MNLHICKNLLISLSRKNNLYLHKPSYASSISSLFFSSSSSIDVSKSPTTDVSGYLINHHHFSSETALKVSSVVKRLKNTQTTDSVLIYLSDVVGFSNTDLEVVIKRVPRVLSANLHRTIMPKIKVFRDIGFTPDDLKEIISVNPWILIRSVNNRLGPSILALKMVMGSNANVIRVLKLGSGWFLTHDLGKSMMPNIEYLKSCGICMSQLMKCMLNFPRFFLRKPEDIKEYVKRVDEMGFNRNSKMLLEAIRVLSSMTVKNWENKLIVFQSIGFSQEDILVTFRRLPNVFAVSENKIKDVSKVLLSSGKCDTSYIVDHPDLLICSIEHRIKPRLRVIELLESLNLLEKKPSLITVCMYSKKKFLERYVLPYSEQLGGDQINFLK